MDYGYLKYKAQNGKSGIFWEKEKKKTDRKFGYKQKDQRFSLRANQSNTVELEPEPIKDDDSTPKPNFIERNRQLAAGKNKGKKPTLRPLKKSPTGTVTLTQDQLNAILASVGKVATGEEDNLRISIDSKKNEITIESPRKSRDGDYHDHNSAESGYDDDDDKYNDNKKDRATKSKTRVYSPPNVDTTTTIFSLLEEFKLDDKEKKPSKSSKRKEIEKKKFELEELKKREDVESDRKERDDRDREKKDRYRKDRDSEHKDREKDRNNHRDDRDDYKSRRRDKERDRNNHRDDDDDDDHDYRSSRHKKKTSRERRSRRYSPEQQDSEDDYDDRRKKGSHSHRRNDSPEPREKTHRDRRRERTPSDEEQRNHRSPERSDSKPPTGRSPAPKTLTLAERKKLQWEKDRIELAKQYDPWGRPGAGAPIRTKSGNVAADYKTRQVPTRVVHDRNTFLIM